MEVVKSLLNDPSCNVDAMLTRDLYFNISYQLAPSPTPTSTSLTAFNWACAHGQFHVVEFLLKSPRIDPTKKSSNETTPFNTACYRGRDEVVKLLLRDPRIDVNEPNKSDMSPINNACFMGHLNVAFMLASETRVNVKHTSASGASPLQGAAFIGHASIVGMLLTSDRVDINQFDSQWTAISIAAYYGNLSTVQRFLASGRPINLILKNKNNKTALEIALSCPTRERLSFETDEVYNRAKKMGPAIARLLTEFGRNFGQVQSELRAQRESFLFFFLFSFPFFPNFFSFFFSGLLKSPLPSWFPPRPRIS